MDGICWLSGGNDHAHPFPLSCHTASMLLQGIREYLAGVEHDYETENEDAYCSWLRIGTAKEVCEELHGWALAPGPVQMQSIVEESAGLLRDLKLAKKRFARLAAAETEEYRRTHGQRSSQIDAVGVFAALEEVAKVQRAKRGLE